MPEDRRSQALDEQVAAFPYVNGKLFEELLPMADFSAAMREALLDARAQFPDASLADLYDPLTMPPRRSRRTQSSTRR